MLTSPARLTAAAVLASLTLGPIASNAATAAVPEPRASFAAEKKMIRTVAKLTRSGRKAEARTYARAWVVRAFARRGETLGVQPYKCVRVGHPEFPAWLARTHDFEGARRGCFVNISFVPEGAQDRVESSYFVPIRNQAKQPYLVDAILIAG